MKFLVFGTGEYYERFKKWIEKEEIVALIDNSPAKQNTFVDGKEVLSPEEGISRSYDAVIIMSFYIKVMKQQLIEMGVAVEKIYHFYDLRKLISVQENRQVIRYYGITEQELRHKAQEKIALLSTDMALGGTAIALFHMAKVLKKQEYSIVFASMMDGPLRARIEEQGIPVIIDSNLQLATMREVEWLSGFRLIICSAINYYIFLSERDLRIPMIWWLHDSDFFYDGVDREVLRKIEGENLITLSVGPVPERAIHKLMPEMPVERLLYGVEDVRQNVEREGLKNKVIFVTIGCIEERKGQDILLRAIGLLKKDIRKKAAFYLVGKDTSLFAEQIREKTRFMPEIIMPGAVGRERLHELLENADVMVCPSREDPMPTVAAEAMQHGVPCVVSDVTGTADYIREGQNGLIFESENVLELAGKISWCIENRAFLSEMGKGARKVYETVFSMEKFEEDVNAVVYKSLRMERNSSDK